MKLKLTPTVVFVTLYILLFLFSHTYNLLQFPPMPDEIRHILRAQATLDGDWFIGLRVSMKQFHTWLIALLLPWNDNQLWAARALSIFSGLINALLSYQLAYLLYGQRQVALAALWVYSWLPLAFFFDRLAFADSVLTMLIGITLWGSVRLWQQPRGRWAVVVGLALNCAILTKPYIAIFYLAPLMLWGVAYRRTITWSQAWPWLMLCYGIASLAWLPVLLIGWQAYQADHVHKVMVEQNFIHMWLDNLRHSVSWFWLYLTPPFFIVIIGAVWRGVLRQQLPTLWLSSLSLLFVIILAAILNEVAFVLRYIVPLAIPLSVLAGCGFVAIADRLRLVNVGRVGLLILITLWAAYFNYFLLFNPAQAPVFEVQAMVDQTHTRLPYEASAAFITALSHAETRPIIVLRGYTQENLFHQLGGIVSFFVPRSANVTFKEVPEFSTAIPPEIFNRYAQDYTVLFIVTTSSTHPKEVEFHGLRADLNMWPQLKLLATFPDPNTPWLVQVYAWEKP